MRQEIDEIHGFWFGPLDASGFAGPAQNQRWFSANADLDADIRNRFGVLVARGLAGELDPWAEDASGLLALVLLLDQFTRNIHRGTAQAFSGDAKALSLAREAIAAKQHRSLPAIHRVFLYLPLEHCEDLQVQEECLELFTELADDLDADGMERVEGFARFAVAHRDVIARFGRFPHRNAILGRSSTAQELEYLQLHGGF